MDLLSLTLEFCSEDVLFAFLYLADLGWCQFLKKSLVPMLTIKSYSLTDVGSYSPAAVLGFWAATSLHTIFTGGRSDSSSSSPHSFIMSSLSDIKTWPYMVESRIIKLGPVYSFVPGWLVKQTRREIFWYLRSQSSGSQTLSFACYQENFSSFYCILYYDHNLLWCTRPTSNISSGEHDAIFVQS